jgi:hypothetical protein
MVVSNGEIRVSSMKLERIMVVEKEKEYYVVYEEAEQDWIAKFDKSWSEAKDWAFQMVDMYNERI